MRVFCVIFEEVGRTGKRRTLVGVASGELVEDLGEEVIVDLDRVGDSSLLVGKRTLPRRDCYATPEEVAYFGELVGWFYSAKPLARPRPTPTRLETRSEECES